MSLIAFPRALPDEFGVMAMSFTLEPMVEVSPLRSGMQIAADLGPALWRARYESGELTPSEAGVVAAWHDTLSSLQHFYGYHRLREYPLAYASGFAGLTVGGNPFSGDCNLADVIDGGLTVTLNNLPAGFAFSAGDLFAFDYGADSRALHRVSAAAVASGGGSVSLECRPAIRPGWQAGATVHLHRAAARMIILPGSYDEKVARGRFTTIAFDAIQSL